MLHISLEGVVGVMGGGGGGGWGQHSYRIFF